MATLALENPSPEDLLEAVDQLDGKELQRFVAEVLARAARRVAPVLRRRESELLEVVNESGFPARLEDRYRELIAARQAETLSPDDLEELKNLTTKAESLQASRLKSLVELSKLRGVSLDELMDELGIHPLLVE